MARVRKCKCGCGATLEGLKRNARFHTSSCRSRYFRRKVKRIDTATLQARRTQRNALETIAYGQQRSN